MKVYISTSGGGVGSRVAGFSLVEMVATIGVIAVMAGIGVTSFKTISEKSKEGIARSVMEKLNKATHDYNHAYKPFDTPFLENVAGDELAILMSLQYREPDSPAVGEPFMRPDWTPAMSSSTADYRYIWKGRNWDLLLPGETGAGLKVEFDGSDIGDLVEFPPGYARFGSH